MRMDAHLARKPLTNLFNDFINLIWQAPAVCIAQHKPAGSRFLGRLKRFHRKLRVVLIAVKKMLRVEKYGFALFL